LSVSLLFCNNSSELLAHVVFVEAQMVRSIFAWSGFLFSCLGIVLFIAVGAWVWSLKAEVDRQSETLANRANTTLDSAKDAIGLVRKVIDQAQSDLDKTRKETTGQSPHPFVDPVLRITAEKASEDLAGSVERAHNAVVLASEAVVVAGAAIDVVDQVDNDNDSDNVSRDLKKILGVQPGQLDATRTALGRVTRELQQAKSVLGGNYGVPTNEQLYAVDDALRNARGFTEEVSSVVESTRTRVNDTKQKVNTWAWRGAWGMNLLSALGMLGQFFMARHFWCRISSNRVGTSTSSPKVSVAA
jgi:hydrogenase maturation protease